jgi:hypothetical protein
MRSLATLNDAQRGLLDTWLPGVTLVRDHSWGLVGTVVLEVRHGGRRLVVKAGDAADHHLAREIRAHREWLAPWTAMRRAPELLHADVGARLLVREFLDGELVLGGHHEWDADTYLQAGRLLSALHQQDRSEDISYEIRQNDKALRWLDTPHRIPIHTVDRLRREIAAWPTPPSLVVPTHGDWQPRNWLVHHGELRVIDLGRAELRPAHTDFVRLEAQQFQRRPDLEAAFLRGYGTDPREPAASHRSRVREAIGTAAWAHQVGDTAFEAQGLDMVATSLPG